MAAAAGGAVLLAKAFVGKRREFDFRGRTALITGGSRGLGLVLARQLAERGARIVICARDSQELEAAHRNLVEYGADVLALRCDLTQRDEVNEMIDLAEAQFGPIDILINNAGIIGVSPIEHVTMDDYHETMDCNFWSAVNVTYHLAPRMQQRGEGRIANVSSIGGKIGVPHLAAYSASKFALVGWSQAIRAELAKNGVVVTTVCPGLMRTGSPRHAEFKGQNEAEYAWFKNADSIPGLSVSAEYAAESILNAIQHGDAEIIIGTVAKVGAFVNQLMPEITSDLMSVATRMLPGPGGIGESSRTGAESESAASRNPVTNLTDQAAQRNNEEFA